MDDQDNPTTEVTVEQLRHALITFVVVRAPYTGRIGIVQRTPEQIEQDLYDHAMELRGLTTEELLNTLTFMIDYSEDVLQEARDLMEREKYYLASILYSTWIEHWLNDVLLAAAARRQTSNDEIERILRRATIRNKVTSLFPNFDLPPLSQAHVDLILQVADLRNDYVHYKWVARTHQEIQDRNQQLKEALLAFEETLSYFQSYRTQFAFGTTEASEAAIEIAIDRVLRRLHPGGVL